MLAVVGDRFPRTGAVAMSIMGGIGMLSAGLIGGPGLGYAKDRFAGEAPQGNQTPRFTKRTRREKPGSFLFLGSRDRSRTAPKLLPQGGQTAKEKDSPTRKTLAEASITGDRKTLKADSFIPATMAVIFLLLLIYFKSIGGYRPLKIDEQH